MIRWVLLPFFVFQITAHAEDKTTETNRFDNLKAELNSSLDQLDKKIDDLETKSAKAKADTKTEWETALKDLRRHRDEIKAEIKKHADASKEKASDFASRIKAAIAELQAGVENASKKLKEKK